MIKRTSRNFKVPLVYGGQWKDHQSFQKWDPISKRLVTVNCCLPQKCFQPEPVTNVTLTSMVSGSAVVSWNYPASNVLFEVNIYEGVTENVDTSGTPKYTVLGLLSGSTVYFTNTSGYYYVATVRVRNDCLFSGYTASSAVQYVFAGYNFQLNSIKNPGDPTTGKMNIIDELHLFDWGLYISTTDYNSNNVTGFLTQLSSANTIKIQKDLYNYKLFTRRDVTIDYGTYQYFPCNIVNITGTINEGDVVNITYN